MNTTLVKIDATEKDIIARTMVECNVSCNFFTIEENPAMLLCEVGTDRPADMWHLGKMVGMASTQQLFESQHKKIEP